ncbi:NADH-quinone oxidoreductase subunit N [Geminisphaera colitermitum]|uniref:NADH-quinone oxidoreductase subunit N n=1 Tax=Geminisphaera colitermitum TaxID=1148786 RepID=UPI000694988F|nr:NADH-quinone oxidoreductase subunit N [Geminisphaera colitermitum]
MPSPNPYIELLHALRPEIMLTLGMLIVLAFDLSVGRRLSDRARLAAATAIALGALASAAFQTLAPAFICTLTFASPSPTLLPPGAFILDSFAAVIRLGVLALAALTFLLPSRDRNAHPAEHAAIVLLATAGFTLMAVANNLLVAFLGLELASLSLYILAALDKTSPASAEAGLKYFLFGGMAAAFLLFGFSLIYGFTGSIQFDAIAAALAPPARISPLLLVALVMVLVGFGYKAAAAPFHLWAPDVYEGAPSPAAALIASASKLAGLALFFRLLHTALAPAALQFAPLTGWLPVLLLVSAASILLGNIAALAQTSVRRLIAYSAIAHAGVLLLGVALGDTSATVYYALTYGLATIGIFGVLAVLDSNNSPTTARPINALTDLAGLWKRSPFLAAILFVCVLSLAGIPPLAGFFGKFYLFAAALRPAGLASPTGWLAILAIAMSAVALYYYLQILKQALVTNPPPPPLRRPSTRLFPPPSP